MRHENIEYQCPACKQWSNDDEVCSICGQKMPPECSEEGFIVPGFDQMSEAERKGVFERIEKLRRERDRKS